MAGSHSYRVEWLAYPDIEAKLRSLGITGWPKESGEGFPFTCPALAYTDSETGERKAIMGSVQIAQALEALQPEPRLGDIDPSEPDVADYRTQIANAWPALAYVRRLRSWLTCTARSSSLVCSSTS